MVRGYLICGLKYRFLVVIRLLMLWMRINFVCKCLMFIEVEYINLFIFFLLDLWLRSIVN